MTMTWRLVVTHTQTDTHKQADIDKETEKSTQKEIEIINMEKK